MRAIIESTIVQTHRVYKLHLPIEYVANYSHSHCPAMVSNRLPLFASLDVNFDDSLSLAYRRCRDFEIYAISNENVQAIISARVLGYLILYAPSTKAATAVAKSINSLCGDYLILFQLGQAFINYLIRPCMHRPFCRNLQVTDYPFPIVKARMRSTISRPTTTPQDPLSSENTTNDASNLTHTEQDPTPRKVASIPLLRHST